MTALLPTLKSLLGNPEVEDSILQFYLDCAEQIICEIRNTDKVEPKYRGVQIQIAIELFNKRGIEGQNYHAENGMTMTFESADISPSLLRKITPVAKTLLGVRKVEDDENENSGENENQTLGS